MRAIQVKQFGEPCEMSLTELADLQPLDDQIKIDVQAVGVNPVDTYIRAGIYPVRPKLPYTPGLDASGVISAVGKDVHQFKKGQKVYTLGSVSGCYASQVLCTEEQVFALPENVDFSAGAALGVPYSTAYFALNYRAHAVPGETVLIHGASGAVGLAAIQIARSNGLKVIGTAGTEAGLEMLKVQGVDAALNHTEPNYLDAIDQLTAGKGVNVILEMLANVNLDHDLNLLALFGRVVVIGSRGNVEIDPRSTMGKNAAIMGMSLFNTPPKILKQMHAAIHAGLSDGRYRPVIHSELPLEQAAQSHERVMKTGINGKIILIP